MVACIKETKRVTGDVSSGTTQQNVYYLMDYSELAILKVVAHVHVVQ